MHKLRQRFARDCVPTCVAMITDMSHEDIMRLAYPKHKKGTKYHGFTMFDDRKLFDKLGLSVTLRAPVQSLFDIKTPAIISIIWKTGSKSGHAVVWDPVEQKIYDPLYKHSLRHSLYVKNMRWYLEIR